MAHLFPSLKTDRYHSRQVLEAERLVAGGGGLSVTYLTHAAGVEPGDVVTVNLLFFSEKTTDCYGGVA
jgi:hypothetical protein